MCGSIQSSFLLRVLGVFAVIDFIFRNSIPSLSCSSRVSWFNATVASLAFFAFAVSPARADLDSDLIHFQRVLEGQYATVGARHPDVAATLHRIAAIHDELLHFRQAEDYYQRCLSIRRAAFGETHASVADVLNDAAILAYNTGDYRRATERHERALAIRTALFGDTDALVATSLSNLGSVYRSRGDFPRAVKHHERALAMRRNAYGETHPSLAASWNNLATAWNGMGETDSAIRAHRRALAIRIATRGESHPDVAASWNNLSAALRESSALDEARECAERALRIWTAVLGESHPQTASAEQNLGRILLQLGRPRDALVPLNRALAVSRLGLGRHIASATALVRVARAHRDLADTPAAVRALGEALDALIEPNPVDPRVPWRALPISLEALHELARLERTLAEDRIEPLRSALGHAEAALAILHRMRGDLSEAARGIHDLRWREIPAEILGIQKALERRGAPLDVESALRAVEVASAWEFLELVAVSRADLSGALPDRDAEEERQIEADGRRIGAATGDPTADAERVLWEERRAAFESRIRAEHPRYAALRYPEPVRLAALRDVLGETEVALAYLTAATASFLLVVERESAALVELPAEPDLADRVHIMRDLLMDGRPLDTSLRLLAEELLPPSAAIRKYSRLVIAPSGILERVAFEMLPDPESGTLGERSVITYAPSLSILALLRTLAPRPSPPGDRLLAIGNPRYPAPDARDPEAARTARRYSDALRGSWAPLPGTRVEVQAITRLFPADHATALLGEHASEEEVDSHLADPDLGYLHFACHGALEDGPGREPALVLSLLDNAAPDDGFLTLSEILRHPARTRLTVLSACQSGLSSERLPRMGVSSLARAFLLSGSDAVVVSLWPVSDEATARLMTAFYRGMRTGALAPAEALERARASLRANPRFAHPGFWAPFVIVGH
jgi:CHAT domain-containing protein/tetratricopeptide (TPR) repeat protein